MHPASPARIIAGMRAAVQRVSSAEVIVEGQVTGRIAKGLLVYVGVGHGDDPSDVDYLTDKITHLRIFRDEQGKMNLSVADVGGAILVISAFALQADARKGRRPSFDAAADPDTANGLYEKLCDDLAAAGLRVERGVFRAHMNVASTNDGPICILLDSRKTF
jgi:D-tyrosyl-tRNA(Tyr) deacylase